MRKQTLTRRVLTPVVVTLCAACFVFAGPGPVGALTPAGGAQPGAFGASVITLQPGECTQLELDGVKDCSVGAPELLSAQRTGDGVLLQGKRPGLTVVAVATRAGTTAYPVRIAAARGMISLPDSDRVAYLEMQAGDSQLEKVDKGRQIKRVAVNLPEVVEAVPVSETEVILNARKEGTATVRIWDTVGLRTILVRVAPQGPTADELAADLQTTIGLATVNIRAVGDTVLLSGTVSSEEEVRWVGLIAERSGRKVVNLVRVQPISSETVVQSIKDALKEPLVNYEILADGTVMIRGTVASHEEAARIKDIITAWASDGGKQAADKISTASSAFVTIGGERSTAPDALDRARVIAQQNDYGETVLGEEFNLSRSVFSGRIPNGPRIVGIIEVNPAVARQVLVSAQVLEVDRTKLKQHGFDWGSILGDEILQPFVIVEDRSSPVGILDPGPIRRLPFGAKLRALIDDQAVRILSEPKVLIADGHPASILVGGELPIPTAQTGGLGATSISVTYKPFGIQLTVRPRIAPDNRILLTVSPEVSDIDTTNTVKTNDIEIPGIATRRATTTVHIENGQSLAIGGLLSTKDRKVARSIPLLSKIPVIGELFKSRELRKDEKELIILVTPTIIENNTEVPIPNPGSAE